MNRFARLVRQLDLAGDAADQEKAIREYLGDAPVSDAAWAVHFLSGRGVGRVLPARRLVTWAAEVASVPEWLMSECGEAVPDTAQAAALVLPLRELGRGTTASLSDWVQRFLVPMLSGAASAQNRLLRAGWAEMDLEQCLAWHRVLMGQFESGRHLAPLARALAAFSGVPLPILVRRLATLPAPGARTFEGLLAPPGGPDWPAGVLPHRPAEVADGEIGDLGEYGTWRATWLPVGAEVQVLRRNGELFVWPVQWDGRLEVGEELSARLNALPDGTVLHGVLGSDSGRTQLAVLDVWEEGGREVRTLPFDERRRRLERVLARSHLAGALGSAGGQAHGQGDLFDSHRPAAEGQSLVAVVAEASLERAAGSRRWCEEARRRRARGLLVFPADPALAETPASAPPRLFPVLAHRLRAVLVAVQPEAARGGGSVAIGTFGVWSGRELTSIGTLAVPESELDTSMLAELMRLHTMGRFGPVRRLAPMLVFELECDAVEASERHKAGLTMRSPRITRRLDGVGPSEADSIDRLRSWIVPGDAGSFT